MRLLPVLAVALIAGCGGKKRDAPPKVSPDTAVAVVPDPPLPALAPSRLDDGAEVARIEAALIARLRANQRRECPDDAARRAMIGAGGDPLAACARDFAALGDAGRAANATCTSASLKVCTATPLTEPPAELAALLDRCAQPVVAGIAAVLRNATPGCSPLLAGRGPMVALEMLHLGQIAIAQARELARGGAPTAGIRLLLDLERLLTAQAGTDLGDIGAAQSMSLAPRIAANLARIVQDAPPSDADRIVLAAELDAVVAAIPDWATATASEDLDMLLGVAWPLREPAFDLGIPDRDGPAQPPKMPPGAKLTPRELYGLLISAGAQMSKERAAACRAIPPEACAEALSRKGGSDDDWLEYVMRGVDGDPTPEMRGHAIPPIVAAMHRQAAEQPRELAHRLARLAESRAALCHGVAGCR